MQAGFLGSARSNTAADPRPKKGTSDAVPAGQSADCPAGVAIPSTSPTAVLSSAAPSAADLQVGLASCLELLSSPVDERKYVGLLLVTKLLPAGDEATLRQIYSAVGPVFVDRLLLQLKNAQELPAEAAEQAIASAGLGLAVLASCCRLPEVAASEQVLEKVPLFIKVVGAGGLEPLFRPSSLPAIGATAVDVPATRDAMECLMAAMHASEDARIIARESGVLAACVPFLQAADLELELAAMAVQVLTLLLDAPHRTHIIAEEGPMLLQAIPLLAQLLQLAAPQQQDGSASGEGPTQAAAAGGAADRAALQLRALHALLLLLPVPLPQGAWLAERLEEGARSDGGGWAAAARAGLRVVLGSRVAPQQRHAALQLAAALAQLAGPPWLLPQGEGGQEFFQLVVEVVKVETRLLLSDALLAVEAPLPGEPSEPSSPRPTAIPADKQQNPFNWQPAEEQSASETVEVEPSEAEALEGKLAQSAAVAAAGDQQLGTSSDRAQEGNSAVTVERAHQMLPACFSLLEAAVEVLAADAALADSSDLDAPLSSLSPQVAERAMWSLHEAAEAVMQYLEALAPHSAAAAASPYALAALRALARYAAEAPGALAQRLQAALPSLLTLTGNQPGSLAAPRFLLPFLLQQATQTRQTAPADGSGQAPSAPSWAATLLQPQMLDCIASLVAEDAAAAVAAASDGARDSHVTAAHAALLDSCSLLLTITASIQQTPQVPGGSSAAANEAGPSDSAPSVAATRQSVVQSLLPAMPALRDWGATFCRPTSTADLRVLAAVGATIAVVLEMVLDTPEPSEVALAGHALLLSQQDLLVLSESMLHALHSEATAMAGGQLDEETEEEVAELFGRTLEAARGLLRASPTFLQAASAAPFVMQWLPVRERLQQCLPQLADRPHQLQSLQRFLLAVAPKLCRKAD